MPNLFRDRREAGEILGGRLLKYRGAGGVVVLGLPRGGIIVAGEIAKALRAPLDAFLVRKLGVPGGEETAMGAIAEGGVRELNEPLIARLGIPAADVEEAVARESKELARRERLYRGGRPPVGAAGKTVILADDGAATGSTMLAAIEALRALRPARIVAALPVASPGAAEAVSRAADEAVVAETPPFFRAVGEWYGDFGQTTDKEVLAALAEGRRRRVG